MTEEEKLVLYVKYCIGQIPGYAFPCDISIRMRRNWSNTRYVLGDNSIVFDAYTGSIRHMVGRIWLGMGMVYLVDWNNSRELWHGIPDNIMKYDQYLEHGSIRTGLLKVPLDIVTEKFK